MIICVYLRNKKCAAETAHKNVTSIFSVTQLILKIYNKGMRNKVNVFNYC